MSAGERVGAVSDNVARTAVERSGVYGFLATVFREPMTAAALKEIRAAAFLDALRRAGVDLGQDFADAPEDALLDELAIDYTQLFHGPRGHIPPFESIQTGRAGASLNDETTERVRRFFESAGLALDADCRELADHVRVELEFMAQLLQREAAARESGDRAAVRRCLEAQRDFLKRHLGTWGPGFAAKVQGQAETRFYGEAARLLRDFLEAERLEIERRLRAPHSGVEKAGEMPDDMAGQP